MSIVTYITESMRVVSNLIGGGKSVRLKTQNLTIGQQQILDGFAFETNWVEQAIPVTTSRYAEFTNPSGYKMVLALRILNPQSDNFLYRVYPQGTYTAGTAKTDDAHNFTKSRNLNQDSGFSEAPLIRINMLALDLPDETDQIIYEPVWGQVNAGNRSAGTLETDDSFLILNPDQTFLLEMRNGSATNAGGAQVKLQYAFIPEVAIPEPLV